MSASLHYEVVGYTWAGGRACYQYTAELTGAEPSRKAARAVREGVITGTVWAYRRAPGVVICGEPLPPIPDMGDFESIEDCRIILERITYERAGTLMRRVDEQRVLAGFKDRASAGRYARATYRR